MQCKLIIDTLHGYICSRAKDPNPLQNGRLSQKIPAGEAKLRFKSLHYKASSSRLRGRLKPSLCSRIAWRSVGLPTHRLRICWPQRVGRITSTVWIAAISSSTFLARCPGPPPCTSAPAFSTAHTPGSRPVHGPARDPFSGARPGAATGRFYGCGMPPRCTTQTTAEERTFESGGSALIVGLLALLELARWCRKRRRRCLRRRPMYTPTDGPVPPQPRSPRGVSRRTANGVAARGSPPSGAAVSGQLVRRHLRPTPAEQEVAHDRH